MEVVNKTYSFKSNGVLLLLLIASIALFLIIWLNLTSIETQRFEHYVSKYFQSLRSDSLTPFMKFISKAGDVLGYIIITSILSVFLILKRKANILIQILSIIISSALLNAVLKALIDRPRPYGNVLVRVNFNSFPSGHAVSSIAFYGFIIYLMFKLSKSQSLKLLVCFLCVSIILLIGISRIYLGVHYPTDVLVGYSSGFSYLLITILIIRYLESRKP